MGMFEEATWRRRNRRVFDIAETLASQAGVEVGCDNDPQDQPELAYALVYRAGLILLLNSIDFFCDGEGGSKAIRRIDKDLTGTGGARGCVLLTLAVARTLNDLPAEVSEHLRETFPVPAEDTDFLAHAFDEDGVLTGFGVALVAARAIEIASSFPATRSAPAFRELGELDLREIDFDTALEHTWGPAADDRMASAWNVAQGALVETLR